jgi:endonuclease/exonuclease/phosphatase family metal-dependent hydrolase
MASLDIATWNVLHRVHAENWGEEVPARFPDEAERIARITRRVVDLVRDRDDVVVCLQEVSGDQLASLRRALPDAVWSFGYPRLPSLKSGAPSQLADASEHLVVIARGGRPRGGEAFANDPGKGLLAVDVRGLLVVATHVSYGGRCSAQLARIAAVLGHGPCAVCGDFNASADDVRALLPALSLVELAADAPPTRPRRDTTSGKPKHIDHILVRGLAPQAVTVVDIGGESDHNLCTRACAPLERATGRSETAHFVP